MADKPTFSVVIPTYKTTAVLRECLNGLYNQSAQKSCFEVIVVNDGGENGIPQHLNLKDCQFNIRYFRQEHKGPAAARNLGISKAVGDIILFLDDDSFPPDDWLQSMIEAWRRFPDVDGIGGYIRTEPTDNIYCRVNADFFNWYLDQYSSDQLYPFLVTCNASFKKSTLLKAGNFDETFKKASGEDRDLNIKISRMGGKLKLDETVLVYHDRDLSFSSFIRKHYNYGKASRAIYLRYPDLRRLPAKAYMKLYTSTLQRYPKYREKIMVFLLLTLSQVCTLIGFFEN